MVQWPVDAHSSLEVTIELDDDTALYLQVDTHIALISADGGAKNLCTMRADPHDGPEHRRHTEAEYIDAALMFVSHQHHLATHGWTSMLA